MASSSASSKPPVDDKTLDDIDRLLNREASAFQREREVERILGAFKLNPYDVLDLELGANAEGIKRKYRQISLCELLCTVSLPPLVCFC
jgi:DnaJ homolog subfamily C member 8